MGLAAKLGGIPGIALRTGSDFSTGEERLADMALDAEVLAVALARVSERVIERAAGLRLIVKCGVGTENIDVAAARRRGITVARTSGINFGGVAEFVIGSCIAFYRRLAGLDAAVRADAWAASRVEWAGRLEGLAGKHLGLVGFGAIGREVARLAQAHGMTVLVADPYVSDEDCAAAGATRLGLGDLLGRSDVVSIHVLLTAETRGLIDAARLGQMRPRALLVNTSRGGIVDEVALAERLRSGKLAGAILDVLETEPPASGHPLLSSPLCLLSPHLAGCTSAGYEEIGTRAAGLIEAYLAGAPIPEKDVVTS